MKDERTLGDIIASSIMTSIKTFVELQSPDQDVRVRLRAARDLLGFCLQAAEVDQGKDDDEGESWKKGVQE